MADCFDSATAADRLIDEASLRAVDRAITSRRSIRAFLDTPVPRAVVEDILRVAARAPSGTNTQPWRVYVLTGAPLSELSQALVEVFDQPGWSEQHREEYDYYPSKWKTPFLDRRRKVGWDLYTLLGIGRDNKAAMHAQHRRNYGFFGAPVGLMFTIDRSLGRGSWLDYGMFLQNIMIAARGRGLDTCPQAAFTPFHAVIGQRLGFSEDEMLVCGMALGYADESDITARLVTEREPVEGFVRFVS